MTPLPARVVTVLRRHGLSLKETRRLSDAELDRLLGIGAATIAIIRAAAGGPKAAAAAGLAPDPDPALLTIRCGLRLLHKAKPELFTHQARGIAYALEQLATESADRRRLAEARRLADRLFLLYPLEDYL